MNHPHHVIGATLARFVRKELEVARTSVPMIRMVGFERNEIEAAMQSLGQALDGRRQDVALKIGSHEVWQGCPTEWFLEADETLVHYRNTSAKGVVIFEVEGQAESQSLRNMHLVQDGTFLKPNVDDGGEDRRRELVRIAWDLATDATDIPLPDELLQVLERVFHVYSRESGEVSLRSWVGFVCTCVQPLAHGSGALAQRTVHAAVEGALPHLHLFPDEGLFAAGGGQEQKRLTRNVRLASFSNPAGKDLDEDDIERRILSTEFRGEDDELLDSATQEMWRHRLLELLAARSTTKYAAVPLRMWEQIFSKDAEPRDGLGTRIRKHLQEAHPESLDDYEELEIQTGLDDQEPDAAKSLLDSEPSQPDQKSLADLLSPPLRKAVEKLANPRSPTVPDPIVAIVEQLYAALSDKESAPIESVHVGVDLTDEDSAQYTRSLFRFLYGRTLRNVADYSADGVGTSLVLHPELVDGPVDFLSLHDARFPRASSEDDTDDEARTVDDSVDRAWQDLRLELVAQPGGRVLRRFSWSPSDTRGPMGLRAFARLVLDETELTKMSGPWSDLESWCESAGDPRTSLQREPIQMPSAGVTERWAELRRRTFEEWRVDGIDGDRLGDYAKQWGEILDAAQISCIPHDEPQPELEAFLAMETLRLAGNRHAMLATHPIRLRWAGAYLRHIRGTMIAILEGTFRLNPEVDELFFDKLGELSPHRQPPLLSPRHNALDIATREFGWHEEFRSIVDDASPSDEWVGSIDSQSVTAMASVVTKYLEAHPHKIDGLSVLFISRDGDADHVERLVRGIRSSESKNLVLTVHVIAPREGHEEIARRLELLDTDDRAGSEILPRLRTILHPSDVLDREDAGRTLGLEGQVDLVLVPNLFGTKTTIARRTQGRRSGEFDPLLDDATHESNRDDGGGRKNVSRQFLPVVGDSLLEGWSSLQVWHRDWNRVGEDSSDQVDFFSLQVKFTDNLGLFSRLHRWGHWVVTLDPYVGREQIEASDERPDIITVQPKVGKNGRYTLVVSSSTGRLFVVERLGRRIEHDLDLVEPETARQLAESIYDTSRQFAPGVVLRALGLGRTTQELLGLIVARRVVEEQHPSQKTDCLDAWLSLDELTHWFGGVRRPRADMLRVLGRRHSDGMLHLRVQILEAKFREQEDLGRGESQLDRTESILRPALTPPSDHGENIVYADADIWRRELLAAIEQCAARFIGAASEDSGDANQRSRLLPDDLRESILKGKYVLDEMETILCTVAAGDRDLRESVEESPSGRHSWFRVGRSGLRRVLLSFSTSSEPACKDSREELPPPGLPAAVDHATPAAPTPLEEHRRQARSDEQAAYVAEPAPPWAGTENGAPSSASASENEHSGRLGVAELERRYQEVLNCFAQFDIRVDRPDGFVPTEGPAFYEIRVAPERGVKLEPVLSLARQLHLKLALPEILQIRSFVDRGSVVFQIPKDDDERYFVGTRDLWRRAGFPTDTPTSLRVPLGEDARGEVIWLDFGDESPHLLIGGTTGSGKSVALEAILQGLCAEQPPESLRLMLIDPKETELQGFEESPHLEGEIGYDADDAVELLERGVAEMDRRYKLFKSMKKERGERVRSLGQFNEVVDASERIPWHVIVLDEYADLTGDKEDRRKIESLLQRLTQKARAAGIHVIVATQKPSAEILSTSIRSNLPAQLALRVKTAQDSRIVMDETGAETLAGKGDAFFKTAKGVVRVQTAKFED